MGCKRRGDVGCKVWGQHLLAINWSTEAQARRVVSTLPHISFLQRPKP